MNIQRFSALTSREALAKARMAFGDNTLILSNRQTDTGVEVLAAAESSFAEMDVPSLASTKPMATAASPRRSTATSTRAPSTQALVEEDADQLAMSTLSFQDYVRERMIKRRQEDKPSGSATSATPTTRTGPSTRRALSHDEAALGEASPSHSSLDDPTDAAPTSPRVGPSIASELHAMKTLIEDRFNTLTWLGQTHQNPVQSNLMFKLIQAGFSPNLARALLEKMPADTAPTAAMTWATEVLERNLKTDAQSLSLPEEGGIFALVGATGVGKTSTTAKLASQCARLHGPTSVGLITLDSYRMGAHEQLRNYGRLLGVVAHLAHDRSALQDLLGLLANKKLILIDTVGIAPRDPRKKDMLDVLDLPRVNRLLVLNAVSHGDTLDDAISAFRSRGVVQAVLSKTDEAIKLGPVLDAVIRHQINLRGVTTGQRVPEDFEPANAAKLIKLAMRTPGRSAFDPQTSDLGFFFSPTRTQTMGLRHA
jgi:flagellar biosynthesis protein FlhF